MPYDIKDNIHVYMANFFAMFHACMVMVIFVPLNNLHPMQLEEFPNYIFIYVEGSFNPYITLGTGLLLYVLKNKRIKEEVKLQLNESFKNVSLRFSVFSK